MGSLLQSTFNTRQLIPGNCRYLRSDVPDKITEAEKQFLLQNNVKLAIDLRSDRERKSRPCPLAEDSRFAYRSMPVTTGDIVPRRFEDVPAGYLAMVDAQMERIIRVVESAPCGVLYFCNAGKDRTGVVSALLLRNMGAPRETIIADYVRSAEFLSDMLRDFVSTRPELRLEVVTPRAWSMEFFLDRVVFPPEPDGNGVTHDAE